MGAHLVGRCWSEKLHLPFFSGQASNGICHCYLDSHGATHLGEPRVFSKTHGWEFPRRTIVLKTKSPFLIVLKTKEEKPWISCTNGLGPKQDGKKSPRLRFFIEAQVLHLRPFQFSGQGTLRPFRNGSWLKSARRYPSPLGFFFQCRQGDWGEPTLDIWKMVGWAPISMSMCR